MLHSWSKIVLSVCTASLLLSACGKKQSDDAPQTTSYSPSVIIGSDNGVLYAYQPTTGIKNWELGLPSSIYASPLLYNEMLYVGTIKLPPFVGNCDTLYKINANTGVLIKKMTIAGASPFSIKATPIADGKLIYLATTNNNLYAIDTGSGAVTWTFPADGPLESSPAIYNGQVYFASTAGTIYCVDKTNGNLTWSYSVGAPKSFTSSPSICPPFLYIGCSDSAMYSMYLTSPTTTGINKWIFKTGGAINSSPAAAAGKCIFGSNDFKVYCVDTSTGLKIWSDSTNSNINSSPVIYGQVVYIGSNDYNLYALNIINGGVKWKYATNGLIKSSPLCYKGTIYIGSYDKYFYAIDSAAGTMKWYNNVNGQMQCSPVLDDLSRTNNFNSQVSGYTN